MAKDFLYGLSGVPEAFLKGYMGSQELGIKRQQIANEAAFRKRQLDIAQAKLDKENATPVNVITPEDVAAARAGDNAAIIKISKEKGGGSILSSLNNEKIRDESATREARLNENMDRMALRDIEDRSARAGTPQAVESLKRGEENLPGLFTSNKNIEVKSLGGIKNLVPSVAVGGLEAIGLMPKGAAKERAAISELANAKIYDSSGKTINEQEMGRIKSAMGWSPFMGPEVLVEALRQSGYTVLSKTNQVAAGATPDIVNKFKGSGGVAGAKSLSDLVTQGPSGSVPSGVNKKDKSQKPKTVTQNGVNYELNEQTGEYE